jgi:CRP-like cAMP-binding protein
MQTFRFTAGETILSEGETGHSAYLITVGSVEVILGKGDAAKRVGMLNAGEMFGEMSLIDPGPRSATVKAVTDTECVVSTYPEFVASIQKDPEKAIEFMRVLVRRLRQINELVAGMDPGKRRLRDIMIDWQTNMFENPEYVRRRVNNTFV